MGIWELLLLSVGLAMDAFAVSVCKGLAMDRITLSRACIPGLWFGGFQGLMPLIGWFLGSRFAAYITAVDHWIAFVLLVIIGGNMVREAVKGEEEEADSSLGFKTMLGMAIATSIDALAVGVTFAFLSVSILPAVSVIALVTFVISAVGVAIGGVFGAKFQSKAQIFGGVILILLGLKILLEGIGVI